MIRQLSLSVYVVSVGLGLSVAVVACQPPAADGGGTAGDSAGGSGSGGKASSGGAASGGAGSGGKDAGGEPNGGGVPGIAGSPGQGGESSLDGDLTLDGLSSDQRVALCEEMVSARQEALDVDQYCRGVGRSAVSLAKPKKDADVVEACQVAYDACTEAAEGTMAEEFAQSLAACKGDPLYVAPGATTDDCTGTVGDFLACQSDQHDSLIDVTPPCAELTMDNFEALPEEPGSCAALADTCN
jgi:hypothetical protein